MRVWVMVAGVSVGLSGASFANPLDAPGTVYIDGVACNRPCQAYMAWSRQTLKANQAAMKGVHNVVAVPTAGEPRTRILKRKEPTSAALSRKKAGNAQAALRTTPQPPPLLKSKTEVAPVDAKTRDAPAEPTAATEPAPLPSLKTQDVPLAVEFINPPRDKTPQELVVAALAVAEQITNAEPPNAAGGDRTNEASSTNATPHGVDARVAILISRPDVKSASALKGQNIAIDAAQSNAEEMIRVALAAAGATEAQLSFTDDSPLDRMISGDVEAAVVKLVSPDAAEAFPDIKGFRVLRVPLSSR